MEYQIISASDSTILGHFCVWAHSRRIGKFSDVVVLRAVEAQMERSLQFADERLDLDLFAADRADAMRILEEALYGEGGGLEGSTRLALRYGRFNLTELGISSFDDLYVFLVSGALEQRLIWRGTNDVEVMEARFPAGTYEAVAHEYLRAFATDINS